MSQQASVTLNSVVYNPSGTNNGLTSWIDRSAGIAAGFSPLTEKFQLDQGPSHLTKLSFRLELPVVADSDTACACSGSLLGKNTVNVSVWIRDGAPESERTDLLTRIQDLVSSAPFTDAVGSLEATYG